MEQNEREVSTILSLFEGEDEIDLDAVRALMGGGEEPPAEDDSVGLSDASIEALMRKNWGLREMDVSKEAESLAVGRVALREDENAQDDFTEEEWIIVKAMQAKCRKAINAAVSDRQRKRATDWCFVRGTEDSKGVSFHLACEALQVRPFVVQALIHHYWFQRGIVMPEPLAFMADPLPDSLQSEALLHAWEPGLRIAANAWTNPSLEERTLRTRLDMTDDEYNTAYLRLTEAGMIANRLGRIYLTSRGPAFRKFRRVSWSRSFIGE